MGDENQDDQYQEIGGYRLPVMLREALGMGTNPAESMRSTSSPAAFDRPSLGERIGAKPKVAAPVAPTAPSPDSVAPTSPPSAVTRPIEQKAPPAPPTNPAMATLAAKQAEYGTPLNKQDPKYKMGWGSRLTGALADFGQGFSGQRPSVYIGPGATNHRYDVDEATREANLANVNTQLATQEKINDENRKMYDSTVKQAYESQLGAAKQETADTQQTVAGIKQQLADLAKTKETDQREQKLQQLAQQLESKTRELDIKQLSVQQQMQIKELALDLQRQRLENDKAKFSVGTDAKSLEDERKQRIAAIESRYKEHPWATIFKDKNAEIKAVNDDINSRLKQAGVNTGGSGPTGKTDGQVSHVVYAKDGKTRIGTVVNGKYVPDKK